MGIIIGMLWLALLIAWIYLSERKPLATPEELACRLALIKEKMIEIEKNVKLSYMHVLEDYSANRSTLTIGAPGFFVGVVATYGDKARITNLTASHHITGKIKNIEMESCLSSERNYNATMKELNRLLEEERNHVQ